MATMPPLNVTVYVAPAKPATPRPHHFETWDAAIWFAMFTAIRKRRKYVVRRETGLRGLAVWAVRQESRNDHS